ncbi:helix-turn-helix domain-containing protein [Algoriphagus sp.]|uniref:helix-turn-helix domain-containing protein n=1 Tax=Algoriphagus sp. TaxID=1872435 RepID=UPI0032820FEB
MNKVISFQIPKSENTFIKYQEDRGKYFYDNLHQHPQAQLTLVVEGRGQLLVGDYVGRFEPGDVYLLPESIPHVFRSDSDYFLEENNLSITGKTIFFDFQALHKAFLEVDDFSELAQMSQKLKISYKVVGETNRKLTQILMRFGELMGLRRLQECIHVISLFDFNSSDFLSLNQVPMQHRMNEKDGKRMDQVMRFILDNITRQISLEEVAEQAYMSKEAFCRFFKLRTRRTFTQYVQQLRITEAKKLLLETDASISQVSYQVGFQTLSHFNKTFKNFTAMTPKDWRKLE